MMYNWPYNHTKPLTCYAFLLSQCLNATAKIYTINNKCSSKLRLTKPRSVQEYPEHLEMHILIYLMQKKKTISEVD